MDLAASYESCRALVRAEDRDRYLAALFAPEAKRHHLFALYAFNIEILHVAERVREPAMGEIRLQWWREAIEGKAAGDAAANPVAHALIDTVERCGLSHSSLAELIDAHGFDLYSDPMASMQQLQTYLDETSVALMRLALQVLDDDGESRMSATFAGRAFGLMGLLRGFGLHASRGKIFAPPLDVLAHHGADYAAALSGEVTDNLSATLREMRERSRSDWMLAQPSLTKKNQALAALLPAALVPEYLAAMERSGYDPFRTRIEIAPWKKPWILWRAARR
ncbi:MAG TPA: phytoene/squalene synthase family protein [Xanthobacteraceae bacterium]|nr:phytoene/squalene synthase family protein [Xanthobacteraceae bacterium]